MSDEIETAEMRERLGRSCCPFCGEGNEVADRVTWESPDCQGDKAWQAFACHVCERRGAELYERIGFGEHTYEPHFVETLYRAPDARLSEIKTKLLLLVGALSEACTAADYDEDDDEQGDAMRMVDEMYAYAQALTPEAPSP